MGSDYGTYYLDKASKNWGAMPDWVEALALACDRGSQKSVAQLLDVNQGYVSGVLGGSKFKYHARLEAAVRARLMGETVACPVLQEIPVDRCRQHRQTQARALGPVEKRLRQHCPLCPFNQEAQQERDVHEATTEMEAAYA